MEKFIWILFFTGSLAQQDLDSKVLLFPKDTSTSYVILKPLVTKPLEKLTVCLRSFTELSRNYPLLSLATPGTGADNTFLIVTTPSNVYNIYIGQEGNYIKTDASGLDWKHTCVSWDSTTGIVQLWVNGKLYPRRVARKGYVINEKTSIILGQEQDSFGGGFDANECFKGEITDIHMWDFVLTPDDIHKALFNNRNLNGNIISWRSLQFELKGDVLVQPKLQCKTWEHGAYGLCYDESTPTK
ncbi:C-reactive protein-like [Rhinophrynus dorsalis]